MITKDKLGRQSVLFLSGSRCSLLSLILAFILAGLLRLNERKAPGHLVDREYTSVIFARSFYFTNNESAAPWQRDFARVTMEHQPILEQPLTEYLISLIYRIMGREKIGKQVKSFITAKDLIKTYL